MPNPSHLEAVDPVVEGRARASRPITPAPPSRLDSSVTLSILIHGDAAFTGQGVVAEDLQPVAPARVQQRRHDPPDRQQPGGIHDIGQRGAFDRPGRPTWPRALTCRSFTSTPMIRRPASAAIRLAMAYRAEFDGDVVIDLVGYRRYGHNETDEPSYSQPLMYQAIAEHPSVRELYASALVADHAISASDANELVADARKELTSRQAAVRKRHADPPWTGATRELAPRSAPRAGHGGHPQALLRPERRAACHSERLHVNPKLVRPDRPTPRGARRARAGHRMGACRDAGLCLAPGRRRADPAERPGHRPRHVQPAPPDPASTRRPAPAGPRSITCPRTRPASRSSTPR